MNLPDWFPEIRRPFNPTLREVYDEMTSQERKWSLVFDICVVVLAALALVAGYHYAGGG